MEKILEVKDLFVEFRTEDGVVKALNGVNISLNKGETLGLVGETGAGKTTLAKAILGILPHPPAEVVSGEILYEGENLLQCSEARLREIRGKQISMIFQDPMTSLNPIMTVGDQIAEAIEAHEKLSKVEAERRACEMLELVGITAERAGDYPHQFSGGMKQRVVIAIALACSPAILLADEPTTALDVTIQAQVLEMMSDLKKKLNTSTLLITHDLGVVAQNCDHASIIYAGDIVETGTVMEVFKSMKHPYTIGLMNSIPKIHIDEHRLNPIDGLMPDPMALPAGCAFSDRCRYATERCKTEKPQLLHLGGEHYVKCFYVEKQLKEEK